MLFGIIWMAITLQDIVGCTRKGASGFPWCTIVRKYTLYTGAQELVSMSYLLSLIHVKDELIIHC